jgi:hypothetical protein
MYFSYNFKRSSVVWAGSISSLRSEFLRSSRLVLLFPAKPPAGIRKGMQSEQPGQS